MGQTLDPGDIGPHAASVPEGLVGQANEVPAEMDGNRCLALVDTGSQVTTVASHFYQSHLQHLPLKTCAGLVRVEGAAGDNIPYKGYIEVSIKLSGHKSVDIPVLVMNDTTYNQNVPLLLGTNLLSRLQPDSSSGEVHACVQMAQRALQLVDRHLQETQGIYGTVFSTASVRVKPGEVVAISARVSVSVPIADSVAMLSDTLAKPSKAKSVNVTPGLVNVTSGYSTLAVEMCNTGPNAIKIKPGDKIAQLDQVSLVNDDEVDVSPASDEVLQKIDLGYLASNASDEDVKKVNDMLFRWKHVFSKDSSDLGKTDVLRHRIDLIDDTPVKEKARRVPPTMIEELRQHINQLLDMGVIEESSSPYSSPIVIVRKKSGELRLCVDFRKLNAKTIPDSYRIPTIEELIDTLEGASWFATLDLSSGYHQVEIEHDHRPRTAFTAGPCGFFQWTRMPFGLKNAPALFQRLMERVLSTLHMRSCLVYLDDIIVFGRSVEELNTRLEEVFEKVSAAGLKLKAQKCSLFQQKLKYLGHIVSDRGVECDPEMVAPVQQWKKPENVKDLQSFLGFCNFYRRFIKGFATIAEPLTSLLGCKPKKGKQKSEVVRSAKEWSWGPRQDEAFESLKRALVSPPLLSYPDFSKPFLVRCDASTSGLGAVLLQDKGDKAGPNVIAYASRSLKPSEKHYSPYKLEFLALYWAVTKKFAGYLQGQLLFTVTTDHNPLTYVLTSAKLDSAGHRWLSELTNFNFDVLYKPGKLNTDADALSRLSNESVKAICRSVSDDEFDGYAPCVAVKCSSLVADSIDWFKEQQSDKVIKRAVEILQEDAHVNPKRENAELLQLLKKRSSMCVQDGVLYRVIEGRKIVVVPSHLRSKVLGMAHTDMGHQGRDRTIALCRTRFFWPKMGQDIQDFVTKCDRCSRAKAPNLPGKAPLTPIVSTEPLEVVCMDYLSLEPSKGGFSNLLVITDHFTKFAMAIPTNSQTASNTAKLLMQHFIYRFGIMKRLHSDMGGSFEAKVIKALCDAHGIQKSRTTPFHPEGDGITERFNRTLLNMLRTLEPDQKEDWKTHVGRLTHAYNCTPHCVTGYSPYFLMHGRHPRLPLDALLGEEEGGDDDVSEYVAVMRKRLKEAFESAASATTEARSTMKHQYDKSARGIMPQVGDLVLVRKLGLKGKHKLADKWEETVYKIASKDEGIPVYSVVPEVGRGRARKLHRNHLLPITWPVLKDEVTKPVKHKPAKVKKKTVSKQHQDSSDGSGSSSESEVESEVDGIDLVVQRSGRESGEVEEVDEEKDGGDDFDGMRLEMEESDVDESITSVIDDNDVSHDMSNDVSVCLPDSVVKNGDEQDVEDVDSTQEVDSVDQQQPVDDTSSVVDTSSVDDGEQPQQLRRSGRQRNPPDFYQAGYNVLTCHVDWKDRCEYLKQCMMDFPSCQTIFANAIVKIIT